MREVRPLDYPDTAALLDRLVANGRAGTGARLSPAEAAVVKRNLDFWMSRGVTAATAFRALRATREFPPRGLAMPVEETVRMVYIAETPRQPQAGP